MERDGIGIPEGRRLGGAGRPATILPKLRVSGVIVSLPATPAPPSVTAPALLLAESLIARLAPRAPSAVGVNVTFSVQLVPGARVAPQVLFEI